MTWAGVRRLSGPLVASGLFVSAIAPSHAATRTLESAYAQVAELCTGQGVLGARSLRVRLAGEYKPRFEEWLRNETAKIGSFDSDLPGLHEFCPFGSACGMTSTWYLAEHPEARIRRTAVLESAYQLSKRMRRGSLRFERLEDVIHAVESMRADTRPYTELGLGRARSISQGVVRGFSSRLSGIPLTAEALCAGATHSGCVQAMPAVLRTASPHRLTSAEAGAPGVFELLLAMPAQLQEFTSDIRYAEALGRLNERLLRKALQLESKVRGSSAPVETGDLFSDLRLVINETFDCHLGYECTEERVQTVLSVYGARGASFLGLINYYTSEQYPILFQYGIFSTLVSYLDSLVYSTGLARQRGLYSIPHPEYDNCLAYHFVLPMVLTQIVSRESRLPPMAVAAAVQRLTLAYQLYLHRPPKSLLAAVQDPNSRINHYKRLDLMLDAFGALRGAGASYTFRPEILFLLGGGVITPSTGGGANVSSAGDSGPISLWETFLWFRRLNADALQTLFSSPRAAGPGGNRPPCVRRSATRVNLFACSSGSPSFTA